MPRGIALRLPCRINCGFVRFDRDGLRRSPAISDLCSGATMPRHATLRPARRHPGGAAAVPRRPVDRREELPRASARRRRRSKGISAITINAHSTEVASCTFDEQRRVLDDRAGRDRRQAADRQRHLGRRQPRSRAHRPHGGRRRRLGAAGVPAGAVHAAASRPRWRSRISSASPTRATCRSSCSSIRSRPARAIRATRC